MDLVRAGARLLIGVVSTVVGTALVAAARLGGSAAAKRAGIRACMLWCRLLCRCWGVEVRVRGELSGPSFLVASNHLSHLDIFVLGSLYPGRFVARRQVASWFLIGPVARMIGTIFVDQSRPRDVVQAGRDLRACLESGVPVTVFPEGHTSRGETVAPFLPSLLEPAAAAGVRCYPASLTYETPGRSDPPSTTICWWGDVPFLPHLFRMLRIRRIVAEVRFAPAVVSPDRKELARLLHELVLQGFVPVRQEPAA